MFDTQTVALAKHNNIIFSISVFEQATFYALFSSPSCPGTAPKHGLKHRAPKSPAGQKSINKTQKIMLSTSLLISFMGCIHLEQF